MADAQNAATAAAAADADDGGDLKALVGAKKKKTSTKKSDALAHLAELAGEGAGDLLAATRKEKKKSKTASGDGPAAPAEKDELDEANLEYDFLLKRVYQFIQKNEKDAAKEKRHVIKFPHVQRDGSKKSAFTNFADVLRSLNREKDREHVLSFLYAELQTQGSIDHNDCLILKGRWDSQKVEQVLRKYIDQDPTSRVYTLNCNTCRASRSVLTISSGFRAQVGRRKKKA